MLVGLEVCDMSESPVFSISDHGGSGQFPESMQIRGPRGLIAAVRTLARRKHSTQSETVRQLVIRGLEAEGVTLPVEAVE